MAKVRQKQRQTNTTRFVRMLRMRSASLKMSKKENHTIKHFIPFFPFLRSSKERSSERVDYDQYGFFDSLQRQMAMVKLCTHIF